MENHSELGCLDLVALQRDERRGVEPFVKGFFEDDGYVGEVEVRVLVDSWRGEKLGWNETGVMDCCELSVSRVGGRKRTYRRNDL